MSVNGVSRQSGWPMRRGLTGLPAFALLIWAAPFFTALGQTFPPLQNSPTQAKRLGYRSNATNLVGDYYDASFLVSIRSVDSADNIEFCVEAPSDIRVLSKARLNTAFADVEEMGLHHLDSPGATRTRDCWAVKHMARGQVLSLVYEGLRTEEAKNRQSPLPKLLLRAGGGFAVEPIRYYNDDFAPFGGQVANTVGIPFGFSDSGAAWQQPETARILLAPDATRAYVIADRSIWSMKLTTQELRFIGDVKGAVRSAKLTPDGRYLLVAGDDLYVLRTDGRDSLVTRFTGMSRAIDFAISSDSKTAWILEQFGFGSAITPLDLSNFALGESRYLTKPSSAVNVSPSGLLYVSSGRDISEYETESLTLIANIPGFDNPGPMQFTPDGRRLYVVSRRGTGSEILTVDLKNHAVTVVSSAAQIDDHAYDRDLLTSINDRLTVYGEDRSQEISTLTEQQLFMAPPTVVNAATLSARTGVFPGSIITIYGSNLATGTEIAAELPMQLATTRVTINGLPMPVLFVSPTQINAMVPFEVSPAMADIVVRRGDGMRSSPFTVNVNQATPGIFTSTIGGVAYCGSDGFTVRNPFATTQYPNENKLLPICGVVSGLTTYTIGGSATTATWGSAPVPGEVIYIYATGLGSVQPLIVTATNVAGSSLWNTGVDLARLSSSGIKSPQGIYHIVLTLGAAGMNYGYISPQTKGPGHPLIVDILNDGGGRLAIASSIGPYDAAAIPATGSPREPLTITIGDDVSNKLVVGSSAVNH